MEETIKKKASHHRNIITAAVILLFIIAVLVFIFITQIHKPDPASTAIIRQAAAEQLDKDPNELTDADFAKITELSFVERKVIEDVIVYKSIKLCDIRLLERFKNLQKLDIDGISFPENKIPVWVKFIEKLGFHNFHRKFAVDLSSLEKLTKLEELNLGGSGVKNIKPLVSLINLKNLQLDFSGSDLKPLQNLKKLQILTIRNSTVYDLGPLKSLTELRTLYLYDCSNVTNDEVEDLKRALPNLKVTNRITPSIRI